MHDMDSTRAELETSLDALEGTGFEFELEGPSGETYGEYGGNEYGSQEYGGQEVGGNEFGAQGFETAGEGPLGEMQEMELAAELLEVTNEQELEQFLGKLFRTVGRAAGGFVRGPIGQALGGVLKQAARYALPAAGAALGNLVLPGVGGMVGGKLASAAGKAFGLELEGLSNEDREFEVARRYVRFAGASARHALRVPTRVPPSQAARLAAMRAARRYAPGLLRAPWLVGGGTSVTTDDGGGAYYGQPQPANGQGNGQGDGDGGAMYGATSYGATSGATGTAYPGSARSGRWYRRGRRVILVGI